MKKLVSISLWALALLVVTCLTACYSDSYVGTIDDNYYIKMSLDLTNATSTRTATPAGGEDGDGREGGMNHENDINNFMVFIYRSSDGFDADASTTFLYKGYFEEGRSNCQWATTSTGVDVTFKLKNYIPLDGDRVIVVANAGDNKENIPTLGKLRDYTIYSSWIYGSSIANNTDFVMSSAYNNDSEGIVNVGTRDGSYTDPFIANINIQRTAARIDFMYNSTDNLSGTAPYNELVYNVKENPNDASSTTISRVHVQNIIPLNLMRESSYLIKRVTSSDDITSAVKYGALESTSAAGVPTNYVIEPHTLLKESSVDGATLNKWYGSTRAKAVLANPTSYLTTSNGINHYMETNTAQSELSYFTHYMTLAYTNENTQSKEQNNPDFLTGLLIKAIYEPYTVYTDKNKTIYAHQDEYESGKTFWRYSPTKAEMTEKDCLYFTNKEAAEEYKAEHPEDLAEITEYPDGVCYYTVWLRHANVDADPHLAFPMEYGIVRNNIYRIGIEQYTGPGPVLPAYEDPENMNLRIFVRKWNLRVQPTIRL